MVDSNHPSTRTSRSRRRSRSARPLTITALVLAIVALGYGSFRAIASGRDAFRWGDVVRPDFLWGSAIPSILLAPLFVVALHRGSQGRARDCGVFLAWALTAVSLLLLMPRGVFASGWFLVPALVLLVTCIFGAVVGIAHAAAAVFGLLFAARLTDVAAALPGPWTHAAFCGVAVLLMAVLGSVLQHTLNLAILAEEDQNLRIKEARKALRHRENLLRHAMRVDTVGAMASMVVHQLRNQFQLVMGYAAVGKKGAEPVTASHFQLIVDTLSQSNDMLEGLLGMSRRDDSRVRTVDLRELLEHSCEHYRRVLPASIELDTKVTTDSVAVTLDPDGLEHALLNLVINARQAIAGSGVIAVRLLAHGDSAVIEVEDSGRGIPEDRLEEIFKPFFTTKAKGEGTGLGLAAVQRFVRSSLGEVEVTSTVGAGTVFRLRFPRAHSDDHQAVG